MIMLPNKTLYIRDEDLPVWTRAEEIARAKGVSLSQHVTRSLQRTEPLVDLDEEPPFTWGTVKQEDMGLSKQQLWDGLQRDAARFARKQEETFAEIERLAELSGKPLK
jgi:hypothetical protein